MSLQHIFKITRAIGKASFFSHLLKVFNFICIRLVLFSLFAFQTFFVPFFTLFLCCSWVKCLMRFSGECGAQNLCFFLKFIITLSHTLHHSTEIRFFNFSQLAPAGISILALVFWGYFTLPNKRTVTDYRSLRKNLDQCFVIIFDQCKIIFIDWFDSWFYFIQSARNQINQ